MKGRQGNELILAMMIACWNLLVVVAYVVLVVLRRAGS